MYKELEPLAIGLVSHCGEQLGFERAPQLFLKHDEKNSLKMLGKTAHYDPGQESVTIFVTGRHPKDVLRSLAHELVHHHQNLRGDLAPEKCGEMGKNYAQDNEHMRNMEKEAYLVGNILFRDWEDSHINVHLKESKNMYKLSKLEKEVLAEVSRKFLAEETKKEKEAREESGKKAMAPAAELAKQFMKGKVPASPTKTAAATEKETEELEEAVVEGPDHGAHPCYVHVRIKESGEKGVCIPGTHTLFEGGVITHYDVEFSDRIEENIPINELTPILVEKHSDCPVCPDETVQTEEAVYGRDDEIKNEGIDNSIGLEKTRRMLAGGSLARRVIPKLQEGISITTPEQEKTLYQNIFGARNTKLFDKLTKSWTK